MAHRNIHFSKNNITVFEKIIMVCFFFILLSTYIFQMDMLETILLIVGVSIGTFALVKVILLSKDMSKYQQRKQEINAWMWRFAVFKIVPLAFPFIIKIF